MTTTHAPRQVHLTVMLALNADRFRFRGQTLHITDHEGQVRDYRVTRIGTPDTQHRCVVTAEEVS